MPLEPTIVNDGLGNFAGQALSEAILFENLCRVNPFPQYREKDSGQVIKIHVSFPYLTHEQSMTPLLNRNPPEPQTGKRIQPFFFT